MNEVRPPEKNSGFAVTLFIGAGIIVVFLSIFKGYIEFAGQSVYILFIEPLFYRSEIFNPTQVSRYRVTIEVEVDGSFRTGSGVIERRIKPSLDPLRFPGAGTSQLRGEAIFIDMGNYSPLIMTLREANHVRRDCSIAPPKHICQLVTFDNINDPKSLREVGYYDLSSYFGPNAKIVSVSVDATTDPVSTGIEDHLPWLKNPPPVITPMLDPMPPRYDHISPRPRSDLYYRYDEFKRIK